VRFIFQYIYYLFRSGHRKGFHVHSPFVFNLITHVIEERTPYYKYSLIEKIRQLLLKTNKTIVVHNCGTGISGVQKISSLVKKSSKPKAYAQVLFRLVNFYNAKDILELGTSFGLTTMYLAAPDSNSRVETMEGCKEIAEYAILNFKRAGFENIKLHLGNIDENLPLILTGFKKLDFVFFDANHTKKATLNYFYQCLPKIHSQTVFVIDDIYWSKEMQEAWKEIIKNEKITVSIDMFFYGILLFNSELQKEDYTLFFMP
jgi:predicted O-methyltransferase YrrM